MSDVVTHTEWTCPRCPHPSPGRHTHTAYERVRENIVRPVQPWQDCSERAVGRIVSVTVPLPISDEMIERGLAVARQHWTLADADDVREVLAAALGREQP